MAAGKKPTLYGKPRDGGRLVDGLEPKKSLGQHWLFDVDVLTDIAELAEIEVNDHIVEVGPGLGTLTEVLLSYGARVTAVEFDYEIYAKLKAESTALFSNDAARLEVVNEDILNFRFDQLPSKYKVVANIPYYLTSNLIRRLSDLTNRPEIIVLLIQKEVAERLCAGPGNMSLLSVWAQAYFDCSLGPVVPAALFTPPPKVDSQVVVLRKREAPFFSEDDIKRISQLLKAGFSNKRKTLHNSLASGLQLHKESAKAMLESARINPGARPQELTLEQWVQLARQINT